MVKIKSGIDGSSKAIIVDTLLSCHLQDGSVSVSLKYYRKSCECLGAWQPKELKKFSAIIEKIAGYSACDLKRNSSLFDNHRGPPAEQRFTRPDNVSDDVQFFELKVDASNKARIHGFFVKDVFFLVWLDRNHECFPS